MPPSLLSSTPHRRTRQFLPERASPSPTCPPATRATFYPSTPLLCPSGPHLAWPRSPASSCSKQQPFPLRGRSLCVMDLSLLELLWEQFFLCRRPSWNTTNHNARRRDPATAGLVTFSWRRPPIISVDSRSHLTPINTPNEKEKNRKRRRDEIDFESRRSRQGMGPVPAVVSVLWVTEPGLFIYQHFLSPGRTFHSACPLVFSLSPPFRHFPQAFTE